MAQRICSIEGCNERHKGHGLCQFHYGQTRTRKDFRIAPKPSITERLWANIVKDPHSGCWIWQGAITAVGYGELNVDRIPQLAHRLMYALIIEPIEAGRVADHLCHALDPSCPGGNACLHRRCCNPQHIDLTTIQENVLRGKTRALKTHCGGGHLWIAENLYKYGNSWVCRPCKNAANARRSREKRAGLPARIQGQPYPDRDACATFDELRILAEQLVRSAPPRTEQRSTRFYSVEHPS